MKQLFFLVAILLFAVSNAGAEETVKTFNFTDIPASWQLSKFEGPEETVDWNSVDNKGLPISSSDVEYYPWVTSVTQYGNVSKVEVEVYSDYSRLYISEIKVGSTSLLPAFEYGYDNNPEKSFVFNSDSETKPIGRISIGFSDISRDTLYLKSIKITYNPDGIDRELKWSVSTLDVSLGESFENPTLSGETSGVTFKSSNPDVAVIGTNGIVTPLSVGQTTISAICPEEYPWAAAECSYTLNVSFHLDGTGTDESVTLNRPGTLREVVMELETVKIRSIKVTGPINSADIAYLRETTGRFSNLQEIDLSNATLVPDNGEYATLRGKNHDVGMGYDQYVFILSADVRIEESTEATGLGGGVCTYTYYGNQLAGAFSGLTNLKSFMLPTSMTEVAPFLAYGCSNMANVVLPNNYAEIGQGAFGECSSLASVPTSSDCIVVGNSAFYNSGLASFDFSKIKAIGEESFSNVKLSDSLLLPAIETIGNTAFYQTEGITAVSFGNCLKSVGDAAFRLTGLSGKLILPEGCISIGDEAFADTEIAEIEIPSSCISVGMYPFARTPWFENAQNSTGTDEVIYLNHIALAFKTDRTAHASDGWTMSLEFREGTTTIADGFGNYFYDYGNDKISALILPSTLRWIGNEAFYNILEKTEVVEFPQLLEYIGSEAFYNCGVGSVSLGSNISNIGEYAFGFCEGLVKVNYNVPNATGSFLFSSCQGLEKVTFGTSVISIPDFAFAYCTALVKYEFENLTPPQTAKSVSYRSNGYNDFTIGEDAFVQCKNLSSAVLPSNISSVGKDAFYDTSLKTIYCFAATPIDIESSGIFSNGKSTTIYVPQESEAAYEADPNWNKCNIIGADMSASIENIYSEGIINENSTIEVFTINGIKVFEGIYSSLELPSGIYILKSGSASYKIIL